MCVMVARSILRCSHWVYCARSCRRCLGFNITQDLNPPASTTPWIRHVQEREAGGVGRLRVVHSHARSLVWPACGTSQRQCPAFAICVRGRRWLTKRPQDAGEGRHMHVRRSR
jgi:hypothetical protein